MARGADVGSPLGVKSQGAAAAITVAASGKGRHRRGKLGGAPGARDEPHAIGRHHERDRAAVRAVVCELHGGEARGGAGGAL